MTGIDTLSDIELKNLIDNHRRLGATDRRTYAKAMAEYHRYNAPKLKLDVSLAYLRQAAAEGRFVSYGELAEANGASWDEVRYPMNDHLWVLIDYAHREGWPVLSAMIVNKQNIATGEMEDATLEGFIRAAKELGHVVTDQRAFLKAQQKACFAWVSRRARQVFDD